MEGMVLLEPQLLMLGDHGLNIDALHAPSPWTGEQFARGSLKQFHGFFFRVLAILFTRTNK
jgi:hypothetical protein